MSARGLSFDYLRNLWLQKLDEFEPDQTFNVYIDNPFCMTTCAFCIYNGIVTKKGSPEYVSYYENLLRQIEFFNPVFEKKTPDTIYFGGGTASLLTLDYLKAIVDRIPNFRNIPSKCFEIHPASCSMEYLKCLVGYGFTYISFGVQSLNKARIKSQNRVWYNVDKLKSYIEYLTTKGIHANCDLLAYMDYGDSRGIADLYSDLVRCFTELKPSGITIYPKYQHMVGEQGIRLAAEFRKQLLKFLCLHPKYKLINCEESRLLANDFDIKQCFYISTMTPEEYYDHKRHNCSGPGHQPGNQNVLPLGGAAGHSIYGYFGKKLVYYHSGDMEKGLDSLISY